MKIILSLGSLDYPNAAKALLPLLKKMAKEDGSLTSRLMAAAGKLPGEQVSRLLSALPQAELDGIAVQLVAEKGETLLDACNSYLKKQGMALSVSALSLSENMELSVSLGHIDYAALARRFLPLIPTAVLDEHPVTRVLATLVKLPSQLLYSALEAIPAEKLEIAAVYLLNRYNGSILSRLCSDVKKWGIELSPMELRAEI